MLTRYRIAKGVLSRSLLAVAFSVGTLLPAAAAQADATGRWVLLAAGGLTTLSWETQTDGTTTAECSISVDAQKYDVGAIWVWEVPAPAGGELPFTKTCDVACTSDLSPPDLPPGAPEHVESCLKPR